MGGAPKHAKVLPKITHGRSAGKREASRSKGEKETVPRCRYGKWPKQKEDRYEWSRKLHTPVVKGERVAGKPHRVPSARPSSRKSFFYRSGRARLKSVWGGTKARTIQNGKRKAKVIVRSQREREKSLNVARSFEIGQACPLLGESIWARKEERGEERLEKGWNLDHYDNDFSTGRGGRKCWKEKEGVWHLRKKERSCEASTRRFWEKKVEKLTLRDRRQGVRGGAGDRKKKRVVGAVFRAPSRDRRRRSAKTRLMRKGRPVMNPLWGGGKRGTGAQKRGPHGRLTDGGNSADLQGKWGVPERGGGLRWHGGGGGGCTSATGKPLIRKKQDAETFKKKR